MHKRKSQRHQRAANARWSEVHAQAERDAGIPDRPPIIDSRQTIDIDLTSHGGLYKCTAKLENSEVAKCY